jgi:uncharacterized RDD family membrane protein YckC
MQAERGFTSPEGISLRLELADNGARAGAFLLDYMIASVITSLLLVLGAVAGATSPQDSEGAGGGYAMALALAAGFVVQNFYFIGSELWLGGQTLGKRALRLRVVARDGGELDAGRIYARNLMRDLEIFVPLAFLVNPDLLLGDSPVLGRCLSLVWVGLLACFPLLNAERARIGDLVAGTLVVTVPRLQLLPDLAVSGAEGSLSVTFTDAQLDIYGEHELQVLEGVLRRSELSEQQELLEEIGQRIRRKIGFKRQPGLDSEAFLRAFYAAQRRRLEQKLLFGQRQHKKRRTRR